MPEELTARPDDGRHLPIVHGNGTPARMLLDAITAALHTVHDAQEALAATAPNGRDYYPEPGRLAVAEAEYHRRADLLAALYRDLEADAEYLIDHVWWKG